METNEGIENSESDKLRGGLTNENINEELEDVVQQLRQIIEEKPENGPSIVKSLHEILEKANKKSKRDKTHKSKDAKNTQVVEEMMSRLQDYVGPNPKITDYRKLGESCSKFTGIPLPNEMKKKENLMLWFQQYWDQLNGFLEQRKSDLEVARIRNEQN